jgi:hypothetical protein
MQERIERWRQWRTTGEEEEEGAYCALHAIIFIA